MRRRGPRDPGLAGNPVLIGALTVLVTIVAVYLAYNATNGLPFVPTYALHVQAANASELSHGDEVNLGGARVGVVSTVTASRTSSGRPIALLNLQLENSIEPLPVDSTFTVRLKGAIGLKYLQINLGHSRRGFPENATVPLRQETTEVDFDQVLSMFTPATRIGVQRSTIGFGEALAGRGSDINDAIGAFVPLLNDLGPVARNLASPRTDLAGFFQGLEQYAGALAPVAQVQAQLFTNLNTTFRALAGVAVPSLQDTISAHAAELRGDDQRRPDHPPVPHRHGQPVPSTAPGHRDAAAQRPGAGRRVRHRDAQPPGHGGAGRAHGDAVQGRRRLRHQPVGAGGAGPPHADPDQAGPAAGLPHPGAVHLQLRDAVPAQHLERPLRARQPGHLPAASSR